jgi:hypothetical protein
VTDEERFATALRLIASMRPANNIDARADAFEVAREVAANTLKPQPVEEKRDA